MSADMPWWVAPTLAALVLLIFAGAIGIASFRGDSQLITVMLTGAYGLANQAIGYYFGSSSSSQKKDDTLAAAISSKGPTP